MRFRSSTAAAAGVILMFAATPLAFAASSPSSIVGASPNLVLTNADGTCSTGGPCHTYTLDAGNEIQVNLTGGSVYWSLPASSNSSVVSLESESSDSNGDATALFKVVGPGTADLTAGATACPSSPTAGPACPQWVQPWEVAVVGKLATAMALSASPGTSVYGQPVKLVATIPTSPGANPVPTGTVDFYDGTTPLGAADLQNMDPNGDQAILTISTLDGGRHELSAMYLGDQIFSGSNTIPIFVTVNPAPTRLSATPALARIAGPGIYGFSLSATLTRTDTGAPVAGKQIKFLAGSTPICTATTDDHGLAACNGMPNAVGIVLNQGYTANFAGSADYAGSSAAAPLTS